jgi:hypothetical protein
MPDSNSANVLVYVALLTWPFVTFFLFYILPLRKAIVYSLILGICFLPVYRIGIAGLYDWDKTTAIFVPIYFFLILREIRGIKNRPRFRFRWFDTIPLLYGLGYAATVYQNDLGLREFASYFLDISINVIMPYFVGRLYFSEIKDHKVIANVLLIVALIYLPFCFYEMRLSPVLHSYVYGFGQHVFAQTYRMGGWRPMVFMRHGIELGLFMAVASVVGFWLVRSGTIVRGIPVIMIILVFITAMMSKSFGAIILMFVAIAALLLSNFFRSSVPIIILFLIPPLYISNRVMNLELEKPVLEEMRRIFPLHRFRSLSLRITNENRLARKAEKQFYFGYGRFGGQLIYLDEEENALYDPEKLLRLEKTFEGSSAIRQFIRIDSGWIIEYGKMGMWGMFLYFSMFQIPLFGLCRSIPSHLWDTKEFAATAALSVAVAAVSYDLLLNHFPTGFHFLLIGAMAAPILKSKKGPLVVEERYDNVGPQVSTA